MQVYVQTTLQTLLPSLIFSACGLNTVGVKSRDTAAKYKQILNQVNETTIWSVSYSKNVWLLDVIRKFDDYFSQKSGPNESLSYSHSRCAFAR